MVGGSAYALAEYGRVCNEIIATNKLLVQAPKGGPKELVPPSIRQGNMDFSENEMKATNI